MKRTFPTRSIVTLLSLVACTLPDRNLGELATDGETDDGEQATTTNVTTSDDPSASGPQDGTTSADDGPVLECEDYEPPYPCSSDPDHDEIPHACDNAPEAFNPSQVDDDNDGIGSVVDLCPTVAGSLNSADSDKDGIGNECDSCPSTTQHYNELAQSAALPQRALIRNIPDVGDMDGDGVGDACDNCVAIANCEAYSLGDPWAPGDDIERDDPSTCQRDDDGDMIGDACVGMQLVGAAGPVGFDDTDDFDQDGLANGIDGCFRLPITERIACDGDEDCGAGATCAIDDGICNHVDVDGDLVGDVCDTCATSPNGDQLLDGGMQEDDEDGDFVGRACETASCDVRSDPAPMAFYTESAEGKCCTTLLVETAGDLFYFEGGRQLLDPDGLPVRVDCVYDDFELRTCSRLPDAVATAPGVLTLPPGCSGPSEPLDIASVEDPVIYWSYYCEMPQWDQDFDGIGDTCDFCPFAFDPDNSPYVDAEGRVWPLDGKYCNGDYSLDAICGE